MALGRGRGDRPGGTGVRAERRDDAQTRSHIRKILELTQGQIRTDEQLQALNEVMTRGLMLSIGGFGAIVVGFLCGVLGLAGFLVVRKKSRTKSLSEAGGAR